MRSQNNMRMTNGNSTRTVLFTYANDSLVGFTLDGTHYLYTRNIQGDITSIVNANGSIVCRYYYDAYGNQKVVKEDNNSDIADINPFRYRGYFYDTETGLYYLNARFYDPWTGRFISRDDTSVLNQTKAELNGLNLYMYCGDNPVMNVDPSGKAWWNWLIASLTLAAGVVLSFIPGGQGLGISLIAGGISSMVTNILEASGVDSKTTSIASSIFSVVTGIFMLGTPFASLGAGMIGSGLGGLAGGFMFEAIGRDFALGSLFGNIVGGIIGVKIGDYIKFSNIARQGIVIGKFDNYKQVAMKYNLSYYGGMPGYGRFEKAFNKIPYLGNKLNNLLRKLGWANNHRFISNVMENGGKIFDSGGALTGSYAKEVAMLINYYNYFRFLL